MSKPKITFDSRMRLRRAGVILMAGCCMTVIGGASAEWQVSDRETRKNTADIRDRIGSDGTVNGNLVKLYNQQKFQKTTGNSELEKEPEADEKLDRTNPSTVVFGVDSRCPDSGAEGIATQQLTICKDIVKTELAKYRFSLRMYDRAKARHDRLKVIEDERNGLAEEDQGKLQENSNKLLQLLAVMELDRQQNATYMDAYDARLLHLTQVRDQMSKQALGGKPCKKGLGALACAAVSGVAGGVTLKVALDALQSEKKYDKGRRT